MECLEEYTFTAADIAVLAGAGAVIMKTFYQYDNAILMGFWLEDTNNRVTPMGTGNIKVLSVQNGADFEITVWDNGAIIANTDIMKFHTCVKRG